MAKIVRNQPNYLVIGIFMAVSILAVLISVIFADKLVNKFRGGYSIYITFNELDSLVPGSKITVGSGKNIGQVESIELEGSVLVVHAFINKKYKINKDAGFAIFSTSFVGGKYLAVENYTGEMPYIQEGDTVSGKDPISINSMLGMLNSSLSSGSEEGAMIGIGGIISSVEETINLVNDIIKDNRADVNTTVENLTATSIHLNSTMANINRKLSYVSDKDFKIMLKDVKSSLNNLELFLRDVNSDNAPLSLLKDPNITQSIRTIVTNLEETTERVKAKPSLLLRS